MADAAGKMERNLKTQPAGLSPATAQTAQMCIRDRVMHRVQDEATEKIEALTQQMLQQEPMPQTEDILERTRHLNDLKLMVEETVLQTIVLIPR